MPATDTQDSAMLVVGALGGGPESDAADERVGRRKGLKEKYRYVSEQAVDKLMAPLDVLITHGGPKSDEFPYGSKRIAEAVNRVQPTYHFYAHHRGPIETIIHGDTQSIWLNDVNFERQHNGGFGRLAPGCMGLLTWYGPDRHEFALVDDDWFNAVFYQSWWYESGSKENPE